jgi:autotransporter-associated beta strand protein
LLYTNGAFSDQIVSGTGSALSYGAQSVTARYTVLASNTASGNVGWMKTNATISIFANPGIATQPTSITVATGALGAISVVATGDELIYHWRKNGVNLTDGGNISGSTTPNLIINPVGAGDAATPLNGYDVVITNSCGLVTATSSRVGLTIGTAANLVWYGDGANLWDIGTSLEWNINTAVFNSGDNVTFDDTAAYFGVILASSFLSPGTITVRTDLTGGTSYGFGGNGSIVGPSSLLKDGVGTLTITNANAYTGGTTISNGTIAMIIPACLGNGPITLAGGILNAPNVQGFTVNNVINVVADSTIRVNNTSTSALVLTNALTGTGGTLTIYNNTSGRGPTVQTLYPGFTFNQPIILDLGTGTNLLFQGQNSSGNQVFNGIISGGGMIRRAASGGATVLNAANIFSGGVIINNGNIGIGIDSVSTVPPTIDSGPLGTGPLLIDVGAGTPGLFASGGTHTIGNTVAWTGNTVGSPLVITGTNNLTLSGTMDLSGTNRTLQVNNTGLTTISGVISDGGLANGLIKTGTNTLALTAINTYTGPTTVSNGTLQVNGQIDVGDVTVAGGALGGTGTILGAVTIQSAGTLSPGASIGTLTINNDLLIAGNLAVEVNKSLSPSNDFVVVTGTLSNTGAGTVTVTNLGPALAVGNKFTLFNKQVTGGNTLTVTGAGVTWTNKLATDGSIEVLSTVSTTPTDITFSVSGNNLVLSWPADHTGWRLQSQTNSINVGLTTNWSDVAGSTLVNQVVVPINPANGAVFFRLVYP